MTTTTRSRTTTSRPSVRPGATGHRGRPNGPGTGRAERDTTRGDGLTTIGEAAAAVGIVPETERDHCVCVWRDGRPVNAPLRGCLDREITDDVYLGSGVFRAGTLSRHGGRTAANLAAVLWLPFDADLADWLRLPDGAEARAAAVVEMRGWEQFVLDREVDRQRRDLEEVFARVGLPPHRVDYTGYGLCAYVRVAAEDAGEVGRLRAAHKALVARINDVAGFRLVDPQVSDAGTRITRLPPSPNTKGAIPRRAETLARSGGAASLAAIEAAAGGGRDGEPPRRAVPTTGKRLTDTDAAAIVAAVAPSWRTGQRHAIALALGGMLAKAGVPEDQAAALVGALADGDDQRADRERAVRDSYARVRSGLAARGFFALRDALPDDALAFVDARLDALRGATTGRILLGGTPAPGAAPKDEDARDAMIEQAFTPPPAACYVGAFADYVNVMRPTSEAPDQFHLAAILTLTGAMIGRRIGMEWFGETLYPNLYTVLIGRTGRSRKDTAIKRALAIPQRGDGRRLVSPPFDVSRDVSSAEGLITVLKNQPNTLLYLTELTAMLANARRKSTSTILDRLIEAWDTPHVLQNLSKLSPVTAANPYLSIIAATQPTRLAEGLTEEDIRSGFANRWFYVPGVGKPAMARGPAVDWAAAWTVYLGIHDAIMSKTEGTMLRLSESAEARWDAWYLDVLAREGRDEAEDDMRARHANLAIKIALTHAVTDQAFVVDLPHLEPAIALVEWMWSQVKEMMRFWGVGIDAKIAQRIVNQLRAHGPMKRRDLQIRTHSRQWGPREFAGIFEAMKSNGTIELDAAGRCGLPS